MISVPRHFLPFVIPQIEKNTWPSLRHGKVITSIVFIDIITHSLLSMTDPDSKVHGANTWPIWGRQDPGGPHVGPMHFAIWGGLSALKHPIVSRFHISTTKISVLIAQSKLYLLFPSANDFNILEKISWKYFSHLISVLNFSNNLGHSNIVNTIRRDNLSASVMRKDIINFCVTRLAGYTWRLYKPAIFWSRDGLVYWRIYVSFGFNDWP